MRRFTDIHTHVPGRPGSVLSAAPAVAVGVAASNRQRPEDERQFFSLQLHPWHLRSEADIEEFVATAKSLRDDPQLVAIGECGLDGLCTTPLPLQEQAFRTALQVASDLCLPVVIHCVKLWANLLHIINTSPMRGTQGRLIIHGYRKGPALARQLLDAGFALSLGPKYNPDVAKIVPAPLLYHETDEESEAKFVHLD